MIGPSQNDAGQITYNFGAMHSVADAIASYTGAVQGTLDDLAADFRRFIGASDGQAIEAVDQAQIKWNAGMREVREALMRLGVTLGASADDMHALDQRIASTMLTG